MIESFVGCFSDGSNDWARVWERVRKRATEGVNQSAEIVSIPSDVAVVFWDCGRGIEVDVTEDGVGEEEGEEEGGRIERKK